MLATSSARFSASEGASCGVPARSIICGGDDGEGLGMGRNGGVSAAVDYLWLSDEFMGRSLGPRWAFVGSRAIENLHSLKLFVWWCWWCW